jgi:TonB family protein
MDRKLITQCLAALLFLGVCEASAQIASTEAIDSQKPPPAFVAPKPAAERDLSMAKYAKDSFLAGEEGVVGLRVLVRQDGSVGEVQIATSSGFSKLDESAQNAVQDWRYLPATLNGTAVDTWIQVNVVWALQTLRFDLSPAQTKNMTTYYPRASVGALETGNTAVRFLVGTDGKVLKAVIDKPSGHPRLDAATIEMVKSGFHFSPVTLENGAQIGAWYRLEVDWKLRGINGPDKWPCSATRDSSNPDGIIKACTEFLTAQNLTSYERGTAYEARGRAYLSKREYDPAISDFEAGIRILPSNAQLFMGRADAYWAKNAKDLALIDLDAAVQVEPLSYQPYLRRARTYFDIGQQDRALADFRKAMTFPTTNPAGLYKQRCEFLTDIGRPQDALADCDKAINLAPLDADILDSRGDVYFKLGRLCPTLQGKRTMVSLAATGRHFILRNCRPRRLGERGVCAWDRIASRTPFRTAA